MADFDIEAYLEAQIEGGKPNGASKEAAPLEGEDRERSSRKSTSRDRARKRSRSDSRDRKHKRDRDRDRRHRSRSDSASRRRRHRDRSSEGGKRRRSRSRSGSPRRGRSDRDTDRSRDKDKSRDDREKSRESREKDKPKPVELDAEQRKLKALEEEQAREKARQQKEIDDLTKDQRTVFVSQLTMKTTERQVEEYFGLIGKVNSVIMIRDKFTGKHKGFAYVEMGDLETIPTCLQLNGIVPDFQKFPILVKASEAEKNFLATKKDAGIVGGASNVPGNECRIYVGNLHVNLTEQDLMTVLSAFGVVDSINLQRDEVGNSKGYAFVRFMRPEEAATAMAKLAGMELAGRLVKVGHVNDHSSGGSTAAATGSVSQNATANWKLDDDEGVGMQMNSQSRSMLMAKLGAAAGMAPPAPLPSMYGPGAGAQAVPAIGGLPSTCIVMRNMFNLEEETQPNWDNDIKEDVLEECSKYGKVNHAYVETKIPGGFVYLRFAAVEAAAEAARNLNGRWFAGKMITVSYINPAEYQAKFFSS